VRATGIAFDVHNLAVDGVDELGASDGAEWTHARRYLGLGNPEFLGLRNDGREVDPRSDQATERRATATCN
jgi:LmbE family N-acetylglucosaminyl deacetylase